MAYNMYIKCFSFLSETGSDPFLVLLKCRRKPKTTREIGDVYRTVSDSPVPSRKKLLSLFAKLRPSLVNA